MTTSPLQHSDASTSISAQIERLRTCDTPRVQETFQAVLAELRTRDDADMIAIIWQTDDVQMQRPDLTVEQSRDVLARLDRCHDATIGINWDVIDCIAHNCYSEPDNLDELRELAEVD
ncbi:MAG: hypothetical protein AAF702_05145 [Chloroflexota bacterium]